MNYTDSYRLPQWGENDRILRTDFNNAMAAIENGMIGNRNAAQEAHQAASEAAKLPYAVGSYTGNGDVVTVHLGFRPSFVIISGMQVPYGSQDRSTFNIYFGMTAGNALSPKVEFTDDGFNVHFDYSTGVYPYLAIKDRSYDYIAFR